MIKKPKISKAIEGFLVGFLLVLVFELFILPGLESDNTFIIILSVLSIIGSFIFIYNYAKKKPIDPKILEPGETELDYISPDELYSAIKGESKKPRKTIQIKKLNSKKIKI